MIFVGSKRSLIKKTFFKKLFCLLPLYSLLSCGLDSILTIDPPIVTYNDPLYSSADFTTWYCSFLTTETSNLNLSSANFLGTDVYYKIYNNYSSLNSQRSAILAVNSASNNTASADVMINTYGYKQLGMNPSLGYSVFVPYTGLNRQVKFRIKKYTGSTDSDLGAYISLDGGFLTSGDKFVVPFRYGNTKSFDFFDDDEDDVYRNRDVEPSSGDSDYNYSSSASASNTYYVQFFAVAAAFDTENCGMAYSLVLNLGSIPIIKGK